MVDSSLYIHGIGQAVPPHALPRENAGDLLTQACSSPRTAKLMRRVINLTGIEKRHLAILGAQQHREGEPLYLAADQQPRGPGMGARMARFDAAAADLTQRAIAALPAEALADVGSLITVTCTHAGAPGLELPALAAARLSNDVDRWHLGFMGCSAGLAALRLAHRARSSADTLIVACELSSLHFQYSDDLDQLTANLLFADGAAALAVAARPSAIRVVDCRSVSLPQAADQMVWFADDHGLRLTLSQQLPDTIGRHLPAAVTAFLADNQLDIRRIDHWLAHPGGPQILDSVEACLALPAGALDGSRAILAAYGNMSSPTIFFIMRALFERRPDGLCLALAFGPGLTIEMALLKIERQG